MAHGFRKFIFEVFVNGKFPKILPSENFLLYGMYVVLQPNNIVYVIHIDCIWLLVYAP